MKNTKFIMLFLSFVICSLLQAKTTLSFNPEVGKKYTYKYAFTENFIQNPDAPVNCDIYLDSKFVFTFKVLKKTDKVISMEYTFNELAIYYTQRGMIINFSSKGSNSNDSKETNVMNKALQGITEKKFYVDFTPDASIVSITGIDSLIFDLLYNEKNADSKTTTSALNWLSRYKKEPMKLLFESMFRIYPSKKVAIGDNWTLETFAPIKNNSGKLTNTLTFKSLKKGIAEINQFSEFDYTKDLNRIYISAGGLKGSILVDSSTGMINKREQKVTDVGYQKFSNSKLVFNSSVSQKMTLQE
jgi:hypothetical protein